MDLINDSPGESRHSVRSTLLGWPVFRQLVGKDSTGRGAAVTSAHTRALTPRTATADRVVQSVCPYCAVGCGQRVFVKDEKVIQIEGDPDSPVSRGPALPEGLRQRAAGQQPDPPDRDALPPAVRHRMGAAGPARRRPT